MNYKSSGVDIDAGDMFVRNIKALCEATYNYDTIENYNGFCSFYRNPNNRDQLIVASTDGVGSKLLLALNSKDKYPLSLNNIGHDLVAMSVNDIITSGAQPLFFLDYLAIPKINGDVDLMEIIRGISSGCSLSNCVLIGGETAEMPSLYDAGKMDMAGFAVGIVNKDKVYGSNKVMDDDVIIGVSSSGPHSNGFSLINSMQYIPDSFIDWCLTPTHIYYQLVNEITKEYGHYIHSMFHVTGGGIEGNCSRAIPKDCNLTIDWNSWERPYNFNIIQSILDVPEDEMKRVFNLGIGYGFVVNKAEARSIISLIEYFNINCYIIGKVNGSKTI